VFFEPETIGYLGIIIFLVLTGCGLPIPEEVPIILAGVLSSQGELDWRWAFAACLIGALLGDSVMYWIGHRFGHNLLSRHPKFAKFVGADREVAFEEAILRHGFKVMLLARFMVGVRGPVYLSAGVVRVPYRRFLMWDLVCATLVVGTFFSLSFAYGDEIARLVRNAEVVFTLVVLLIALGVGIWWKRRSRRRTLLEKALKINKEDSGESDNPLEEPSHTLKHPSSESEDRQEKESA